MQAETATQGARAAAPGPPARAAGDRVRGVLGRWETLLVGLLAVTLIFGAALSSEFLTTDSFTTGSLDLSEVALMALALTLVIVAAEIDLSVASTLALSSALMADLWNRGLPLELIMPICLGVGALCGAFNGFLVTRLGLPSLAVTIGTFALFRGLAFVIIGDESVTDFPPTWTDRAFGNFAGTFVPNTMVLFAILAVAFGVLLHATPFGRSIYAIGANQEAAYFSGLRVQRIKLILFTLSGLVAGLAGIVISLRNSTAAANVGNGVRAPPGHHEPCCSAACRSSAAAARSWGSSSRWCSWAPSRRRWLLSENISSYWIQIVTGVLLHRLPCWVPTSPAASAESRAAAPIHAITREGGSPEPCPPDRAPLPARSSPCSSLALAALAFAACGETQDDQSSDNGGGQASSEPSEGAPIPDAPIKEGEMTTISIPKQLGNPYARSLRALRHRRGDGGAGRLEPDHRADRRVRLLADLHTSTPPSSAEPDAIIIRRQRPGRRGPGAQAGRRSAGSRSWAWDSDVAPDARSVFVNQVTTQLVGQNQVGVDRPADRQQRAQDRDPVRDRQRDEPERVDRRDEGGS